VYVRADCGTGMDFSSWSQVCSFSTTPLCSAPTDVEVSQLAGTYALLTWTEAIFGATGYTVAYTETGQENWVSQLVTGNSYNYGLYSDASFDEKIATAKGMLAGADRDKLLYEAEETLFGEGGFPVCPVYYYTNMYCNKGLTNLGYTTMGYFFFMNAKAADK
jgi:ABC-type transport system substrate-binding protein